MKTSGLVHLYCGDGKGKTTAAVGLAVRHAGHGGKVVFAQFLKDGSSGECRVLAKLGVTVLAANPAGKFTFRMTDEEKAETAAALVRTFDAAAGYAVRKGATLLVLDEVDKMGSDGRGDPASALLEVLDSEQNYAFRDHYLEIPVDLSRVMFIMTANTLDTIPRPLLDRMEIIEIPSYTDEEKVQIAQRHLLPKERQAHGLTASSLRVDESAIRAAIALYTRESGVRSLERQLGKICRKAAMQLATSDVKRVTVTEKNIKDFLGAPRAAQEKIPEKDLVGVVNGLAWTEVGGEILPVEVGVMDGSGKVELTGNLGDVMQESCRAALSCLRQRAQELGIAPDFYKTKDIHIHFPEGAIPKDGPSAGIAIATAVLSALTGQAVHRDVAMTGEITLRGRVLAIGGLREKTMGALRAGVHTVILPKENEKDLDEIDPLVREKLRFVPVETVDAVFAEALVLPEKCTAAAHESYLPPVQESAHGALRAGEMS